MVIQQKEKSMSSKVLIIAEAGVNHNGSIELAKKLIDKASEAGADYVKFQTFKAEELVVMNAKKAEYQVRNTQNEEGQFEMLKKLELSYESHRELVEYCEERGIKFLSTGFDLTSLEFLNETIDIPFFKIPSGELTNYLYLKKIASFGKPVILSTGMATMEEIKWAIDILNENKLSKENITILHCNTEYPTPMEDVNLLAMKTIQDTFNVKVGYSDHTIGIEIPIAAVSLGATVIEKHFTLDKTMDGPDHKASLEPQELKAMVMGIRNIEKALGNGIKEPSKSEKKNIAIARKSIVAKCNISKGELLTEEKLTVKRPGSGISPMRWNDLIGTIAKKNYQIDDLI